MIYALSLDMSLFLSTTQFLSIKINVCMSFMNLDLICMSIIYYGTGEEYYEAMVMRKLGKKKKKELC